MSVNFQECKRCGHKWLPRTTEPPVVCPKCHSPYWNKPKGEKKEEGK
jgi:predicted Zn-ribbon and HTH transcriptional regulator